MGKDEIQESTSPRTLCPSAPPWLFSWKFDFVRDCKSHFICPRNCKFRGAGLSAFHWLQPVEEFCKPYPALAEYVSFESNHISLRSFHPLRLANFFYHASPSALCPLLLWLGSASLTHRGSLVEGEKPASASLSRFFYIAMRPAIASIKG